MKSTARGVLFQGDRSLVPNSLLQAHQHTGTAIQSLLSISLKEPIISENFPLPQSGVVISRGLMRRQGVGVIYERQYRSWTSWRRYTAVSAAYFMFKTYHHPVKGLLVYRLPTYLMQGGGPTQHTRHTSVEAKRNGVGTYLRRVWRARILLASVFS